MLTRRSSILRGTRLGLVPIVMSFLALVAISVPAAADLGGHDDMPVAESEGDIASTTNPTDSRGGVPAPAGHEVCVRYLSSALTLTFTGDENAAGVNVGGMKYDTSPLTPVSAEVRGETPDRYDGPMGSYASSQGDLQGCHTADAGTTALKFDTTTAAGGMVVFVGAADLQGDSLSCSGGSSADTFQRGGATPTVRLQLHDVDCTISNPLFGTATGTFATVGVEAKVRVVSGVSVCVGPIAPNSCELEWAFTDLG